MGSKVMGLSLTIRPNQTLQPPYENSHSRNQKADDSQFYFVRIFSRLVQSIKTDIGKPFDKSITIDGSNLDVIDFIDQSIEIDTHNHRRSFKVLNLSIYRFYRFH